MRIVTVPEEQFFILSDDRQTPRTKDILVDLIVNYIDIIKSRDSLTEKCKEIAPNGAEYEVEVTNNGSILLVTPGCIQFTIIWIASEYLNGVPAEEIKKKALDIKIECVSKVTTKKTIISRGSGGCANLITSSIDAKIRSKVDKPSVFISAMNYEKFFRHILSEPDEPCEDKDSLINNYELNAILLVPENCAFLKPDIKTGKLNDLYAGEYFLKAFNAFTNFKSVFENAPCIRVIDSLIPVLLPLTSGFPKFAGEIFVGLLTEESMIHKNPYIHPWMVNGDTNCPRCHVIKYPEVACLYCERTDMMINIDTEERVNAWRNYLAGKKCQHCMRSSLANGNFAVVEIRKTAANKPNYVLVCACCMIQLTCFFTESNGLNKIVAYGGYLSERFEHEETNDPQAEFLPKHYNAYKSIYCPMITLDYDNQPRAVCIQLDGDIATLFIEIGDFPTADNFDYVNGVYLAKRKYLSRAMMTILLAETQSIMKEFEEYVKKDKAKVVFLFAMQQQ